MTESYNKNEDIIDRMRRRGWKCYVNYALIFICVAAYALTELTGGIGAEHMLSMGALYAPYVSGGEYWRLFTSMFLHFGMQHLLSNMLLLFFIGDYLERYVGHMRYALIYIGGGLAGNILSLTHGMMTGESFVAAGASGAVYAVLGGLLALLLLKKGRVEDLTLQRVFILIVLMVIVSFENSGVDAYAHMGGVAGGFLLTMLLYGSGMLLRDE